MAPTDAERDLGISPEPDPESDPRLLRSVRSIVCISRIFEQVCREASVSLPQYRLLLFLRHGPERAGELAAKVAIKRPALTALVSGLEKEGRLRRVADRDDARGVRVEITGAGREALRKVERKLADLLDQMTKLGDRELILSAMDDLSRVVDAEIERRICQGQAGIVR